VPVPDRPMVSYTGGIADAAKASIGDATAKLGATVEKVGSDVQDTQDRLSYASGVQNFLAKNLDIRQRAFNDPDYTTAPQRYGAELRQSVTDAGSAIRSPVLRAEFTGAMSRYVNGTQDEILSHATAKAKDADRGWLQSFVNGSTDLALQTPDDAQRGDLINGMTSAVNAMVAKGSVTAAEGETLRKRAVKDYGTKLYAMKTDTDAGAAAKELAPDSVAPDGTPVFSKKGTPADLLDPATRMELYERAKAKSLDIQAIQAGDQYLGRDPAGKPPVPAMPVGIDQMTGAIKGQESGGAANPPTSVNGAVGQFQITPATFAQYAKPGERIDNPADNAAVGQRIITDLWDRTDGDPARIAVGFFSGPGNIAPPGYSTPWLKDTVDGNGKSVSSYVGDVMHRLGRGDVLHDKAMTLAAIDRDYKDNPELARKIKTYVTGQEAIANTEALAQAQQKKDAEEASADAIVKATLKPNLTADDVANIQQQIRTDPNLTSTRRESLWKNLEGQLKAGAAGDTQHYGPAYWDTFSKIHAPDGDPAKITDPAQLDAMGPTGQLTMAGIDKLRAEIAAKRTPEGEAEAEMRKTLFTAAKQQISGSGGFLNLKDPKGEEIFLKWLAGAYQQIEAGKKAGKTAAQLYSPDSPDYVGKSIGGFVRSDAQKMHDLMEANRGDTGGDTTAQPGTQPAAAPIDLSTEQGIRAAWQAGRITQETLYSSLLRLGLIRPGSPGAAAQPTAPEAPIATATPGGR
jgi:hypothetical protein